MAGLKSKLIKAAIQVLHMGGLCRYFGGISGGLGLVFTLHRVRDASDEPFQPNAHLEVTPAFLDRVITRIRKNGLDIVPLDDLIDHLKSGRTDRRVAALTLDDGYLDNFEQAYPVFKKHDAPFTIFTMSGFIDREIAPWWIVLEDLVRTNDTLTIDHPSLTRSFGCSTTQEKYSTYQTLTQHLTTDISETHQREIIAALVEDHAYDAKELCESIAMNWDQIRQLTQAPLSTIGGHTHAHHALARLNETDAKQEIERGLDRIDQETGRRPQHFAFPYGYPSAVSEDAARIIEQAGLISAYTTRPGMLNAKQGKWPYLVPRISLNGYQQTLKMVDLFSSGLPTALLDAANKIRGKQG